MNWTRAALLVASLPLATSGCAGKADATAGSTPAGSQGQGGSVAATVEGAAITWDEMDKKAAERLLPLRQEEYEARRAAIEEIAYERLLAREAEHRGLTSEALLKDEIEHKLKPVSSLEVNQAYEQNKARFAGRPKQDVLRDIEKAMGDQRRRNRESEFRGELFGRAKISVKLEAPRVPVEFPASAPSVGPQAAPITLVEFSDYQCPYCHRAQEAVDQILKQYDGKVRFVHREYPLPGHPRQLQPARLSV